MDNLAVHGFYQVQIANWYLLVIVGNCWQTCVCVMLIYFNNIVIVNSLLKA